MTIEEMANRYAGHEYEAEEGPVITIKREAFKCGARHVLAEIEKILASGDGNPLSMIGGIMYLVDELKGN